METTTYKPINAGELSAANGKMRSVKTGRAQKLDYAWWGGLKTDERQFTQFITVAEGESNFQKGDYELGITWDDAVRIYVDNKLVVDEWNPSKYTFDESPHRQVKLGLEECNHIFSVVLITIGCF